MTPYAFASTILKFSITAMLTAGTLYVFINSARLSFTGASPEGTGTSIALASMRRRRAAESVAFFASRADTATTSAAARRHATSLFWGNGMGAERIDGDPLYLVEFPGVDVLGRR